jgi:hypothetical protein
MIAKTLKIQNLTPSKSSSTFMQMCQDILASETSRVGSKTNQERVKEIVRELVAKELGMGKTVDVPDPFREKSLTGPEKAEKGTAVIETDDSKNVEEDRTQEAESESLAGVSG